MGRRILSHLEAQRTASSRSELEVVCLTDAHNLSSDVRHPRGDRKIAAVLGNQYPQHE